MMPLDEARKIAGQLIMIRIPGTTLDVEMADYLRQNHIRAVCLFRQNMCDAHQLSQLTADLRAVMGPQALIALDEEGGAVVRPTWVPQPPSAMSLGASNDPQLCYEVGAATARAVKALGFNWNFAPVVDLNNNVHNPVIAERSFGSDPQRVITLARAWMQGSLSEGVACCIKHFPGHGDTHVDSHRDLPTVNKTLTELTSLELAPFRALAPIAPAMMTAHIIYPALDSGNPATMSQAILTDLLRKDWQYQGVLITDGMDMHAIAGHYGVGNAAQRALLAGADLVMALGTRTTQMETLDALAATIRSGQLAPEAVKQRLQRIQMLTQTYPCVDAVYETDAADRILMASAWQRGLTAYGKPVAPLLGSKLRVIMQAKAISDGVSEVGISSEKILAMLEELYLIDIVKYESADQFDWQSLPDDGCATLLISSVRARYPECVRHQWMPNLHLVLWNPYLALDIDAPALLSYGFAQPAMQAVASWLRGELALNGEIPVDFCSSDCYKT